MDISNTEKLFSVQDVVNLAAKFVGSQPQDLIDTIEEQQDLSTVEALNDFLKPHYVSNKNASKKALKENYDKGFRKGRKRSEEEFAEVFQVDIDGQDLSSLYMDMKNKLNSKSTKSDKQTITASQAFDVKEVKEAIADYKNQIEQLSGIKNQFDTYKNLQGIKNDAMSILSENGAAFSTDAKRRKIQIEAFERALSSTKYKTNQDGTITILDEDGETPLHNTSTGDNWTFEDWVKDISPVDFGTPQDKKQDKDPYTPNDKNNKGSTFGYTKTQMSNFGLQDWERANKAGQTAEADFILAQMESNAEQAQNSNK